MSVNICIAHQRGVRNGDEMLGVQVSNGAEAARRLKESSVSLKTNTIQENPQITLQHSAKGYRRPRNVDADLRNHHTKTHPKDKYLTSPKDTEPVPKQANYTETKQLQAPTELFAMQHLHPRHLKAGLRGYCAWTCIHATRSMLLMEGEQEVIVPRRRYGLVEVDFGVEREGASGRYSAGR